MKSNLQYMKRFLQVLAGFAMMFFAVESFAQSTITGTVKDKNTGDGMPGVSVSVKGTQNGTMTDIDGKYSVSAVDGSILVFSFVGYENEEATISGGATQFDIELKESVQSLDEVVILGYGTTTKKEVTGAVSTIKAKDFNAGIYSDALGLIQGKVAGLNIASPNGADPMARYEITLRGINTLANSSFQGPLVIIDGIIGADIKNVNFQDVESFDVLKDGAASAIYGTRGSNGVIIITTKSGKAGKPVLEYSAQVSVQVNPRKYENLNAGEFENAINLYAPENAAASLFGHKTDWFDEITNDLPVSYQQTLTLSGGTDKISHRTSFLHNINQGLLKYNEARRLMFKTNIQQKSFNDRLILDLTVTNNSRTSKPGNTEIFRQAFIQNPTQPVYDDSDPARGGYSYQQGLDYSNPVAMLKERTRDNKTNDLMTGFRGTIKITDELKWENFVSILRSDWEENSYKTRFYPNEPTGEAEISNGKDNTVLYESTVSYGTSFGDHNLQALGGYSYQEDDNSFSYMGNGGFDTDMFTYNNIGAGAYLQAGLGEMGSNKTSSKIISLFGRVMYNYKEKYLALVSLRRDGSTKFGANKKWGLFPAVSVGWRLDQENFLQDVDWIDALKLRVGYGVTGNQTVSPYASLLLLNKIGSFYYNGEWIASYGADQNQNPNLQWEEKHEFNFGTDFTLFDNRLSGSLDYYVRRTVNLIWEFGVSRPPYVKESLLANVGTISNRGVELTLNATLIKRNNFTWNSILTATHNKNYLDKLSNSQFNADTYYFGFIGGTLGVYTQRLQEGEELGSFYGPVFLGLDEDGNEIFKNANPVGEVDQSKWEKIGTANPFAFLGWSNNFSYKNISLSFTFRGQIGGSVLNTNRMYHETWYGLGLKNVAHSTIGLPDKDKPVVYSSRYVEDASFLKLDNIAVAYNFNLNSKMISRLTAQLAAQNVFMITGYKGLDPEVQQHGLEPGIERPAYYPRTTSLVFGVTATF